MKDNVTKLIPPNQKHVISDNVNISIYDLEDDEEIFTKGCLLEDTVHKKIYIQSSQCDFMFGIDKECLLKAINNLQNQKDQQNESCKIIKLGSHLNLP